MARILERGHPGLLGVSRGTSWQPSGIPKISVVPHSGKRYKAGMDFRATLDHLGWSKAELARKLGLLPSTVSSWGQKPPQYAMAYLDLALELMALHERAGRKLERTKP